MNPFPCKYWPLKFIICFFHKLCRRREYLTRMCSDRGEEMGEVKKYIQWKISITNSICFLLLLLWQWSKSFENSVLLAVFEQFSILWEVIDFIASGVFKSFHSVLSAKASALIFSHVTSAHHTLISIHSTHLALHHATSCICIFSCIPRVFHFLLHPLSCSFLVLCF